MTPVSSHHVRRLTAKYPSKWRWTRTKSGGARGPRNAVVGMAAVTRRRRGGERAGAVGVQSGETEIGLVTETGTATGIETGIERIAGPLEVGVGPLGVVVVAPAEGVLVVVVVVVVAVEVNGPTRVPTGPTVLTLLQVVIGRWRREWDSECHTTHPYRA